MRFHPLAEIFPLLQGQPFLDLVADIREHGLSEPITLLGGVILDGRNRYLACLEADVEPHFRTYEGDNPTAFVVSLNLRRRHLDESQRAMVASRLATLGDGYRRFPGRPIGLGEPQPLSQSEAADLLNVGDRSVRRARQVLDHGSPELVGMVDAGDVAVSLAADIAGLPEPDQIWLCRSPRFTQGTRNFGPGMKLAAERNASRA